MIPEHINGYLIIINALIALIAISVTVVVALLWKHLKRPGVTSLIVMMILAGIYSLTYFFELLATDFDTKVFWGKSTYLGGAFLPLVFYYFTHTFSQRSFKLTKQRLAILAILPVMAILLSFTNEYHYIYWTRVDYFKNTSLIQYSHGPAFWVYYTYTQILIFLGMINLFVALVRFPRVYISHVLFIIISSLLPTFANLAYVFGVNPTAGLDLTPIAFIITGILISIGVLHLKMFDIIPIARNTLNEILTDGIIVLNHKMIIEDFNPAARHFFKTPEKLRIGINIRECVIREPEWMDTIDLHAKHRIEYSYHQNGSSRTAELNITPLMSVNNVYAGNLLLMRDISEHKQNENSLITSNYQLNREIEIREKLIDDLDSFAHTVAHDIKSSLGNIVSGHSMMQDLMHSGEYTQAEEISKLIRKSAAKALHITQELLALATLGHQEVTVSTINMNRLMNAAITRIHESYDSQQYKLSLTASLPDCLGYGPWIEEVWFNFLSNAIKYGGNPALIEIGSYCTEDNHICFWIQDNGNGIQDHEKKMLFRKFSRVFPERVEGIGLGLSIVKRIIDKIGGQVGVESTGIPGEGSRFFFTLPAVVTANDVIDPEPVS